QDPAVLPPPESPKVKGRPLRKNPFQNLPPTIRRLLGNLPGAVQLWKAVANNPLIPIRRLTAATLSSPKPQTRLPRAVGRVPIQARPGRGQPRNRPKSQVEKKLRTPENLAERLRKRRVPRNRPSNRRRISNHRQRRRLSVVLRSRTK